MVKHMTVEEMFGRWKSDEEYISNTTEEQRCDEALEDIIGTYLRGAQGEGYSVDKHIEELRQKGFFDSVKAEQLKHYVSGFIAGYERANRDRDEKEEDEKFYHAWREILP